MAEEIEKIGNTGIRPQDFYGHCPQCHRDCRDDASKLFLGASASDSLGRATSWHGGKFSLGFEVEDKFKNPDSQAKHIKFLSKQYPMGSVSGGPYKKGDYTGVPTKRCTTLGDIRIGYSDAYSTKLSRWGYEYGATYMKKPESFYAEEALGPPEQGIWGPLDVEHRAWIACRHQNTDHTDEIKVDDNASVETVVNDCVTGIWNGPDIWNVVDTFTTIEEIDIYAKKDYFKVYPICGGGEVQTSAKNDVKVFTVDELLDVDNYEYKQSAGESWDGNAHYYKGKAFFVLVHHGGTGCRSNDARRSLHPHMVGVNAGAGEDYKPTDKNNPDPRPNRGRWFKQAMEGQTLGLYRQTVAEKIGTIYKTTINKSPHPESFQQKKGGTYYTLMHPHTGGDKTVSMGQDFPTAINMWRDDTGGCEDSYGSPRLLQLPCKVPFTPRHISSGGASDCEEFEDAFCDTQERNHYKTFEDAEAALAKRQRRSLTPYGGGPLPLNGCSSLLTFSKCDEGSVTTIDGRLIFSTCDQSDYFNHQIGGHWGHSNRNVPKTLSEQGRTDPVNLDWTGFWLNRKGNQFQIQNHKEYEIGADDWYDIRARYYGNYYGGNSDMLAFLSFYKVDTEIWGRKESAPTSQSYPDHDDGLNFEEVKQIGFKVEKPMIPDENSKFGVGGPHNNIEDSLKAWTCVDTEGTGPVGLASATDWVTNYKHAGVFYRYGLEEYNYSITKKAGIPERTRYNWGRGCGDGLSRSMVKKDARPDSTDCHAWNCNAEKVSHFLIDGNCNLRDGDALDYYSDGCGEVTMNIFTGAGDPPPRYDEDQRVNGEGPCTVVYDDISKIDNTPSWNRFDPHKARDAALKCYEDNFIDGLECPVFLDGERVLDSEGNQTYEPGPCLNTNDWIYAVHRRYYKVKVPKTFWSCGETVGEGSDRENGTEICTAKWPCVKCCGQLYPDRVNWNGDPWPGPLVGCSKCTGGDYMAKELHNWYGCNNWYVDCGNWCRKGPNYDDDPANFCCEQPPTPNKHCINDPDKCCKKGWDIFGNPGKCLEPYEWNGQGCWGGGFGQPGNGNELWCNQDGVLGGEKHSPFQKGFLWYTYFGNAPDTQQGNYGRYSCYTSNSRDCGTIITKCCKADEEDSDGNPVDPEDLEDFIPCEIIAIRKIKETKTIDIELGEIPVKITLRSPDC